MMMGYWLIVVVVVVAVDVVVVVVVECNYWARKEVCGGAKRWIIDQMNELDNGINTDARKKGAL